MDWNRGFSATYYISEVDKVTWRDKERIEITGGSIKRSASYLRASASVDCVNFDQSREKWIRIWLDARQDDETVHEPLFTGLTCSPTKKINGTLITNQVDCYSVLKPVQDVLLPRGWYAPSQVSGATIIKDLLSVTPAPVEIEENSPKLRDYIISEKGENNLSMVDKILTAINWRIQIKGDGTILIRPNSDEPVALFDPLNNDSIEPELDVEYDWYSCPNVFRATAGDESSEYYDESNSPLSIQGRGREVWMEEGASQLNSGETLEDYARRRLKEEQRVSLIAKYSRRYRPDVQVSDTVRLHYPAQELDGVFLITSQDIDLNYGARTQEEVVY